MINAYYSISSLIKHVIPPCLLCCFCHRHTNCGLWRSTDDGAKNMELKKLGMTQEHEYRRQRWGKMRILDWCVNDWCWIPWKGSRRLEVFIQVLRFNLSRIYLRNISTTYWANISKIYPSRIHHGIFLEYIKDKNILACNVC